VNRLEIIEGWFPEGGSLPNPNTLRMLIAVARAAEQHVKVGHDLRTCILGDDPQPRHLAAALRPLLEELSRKDTLAKGSDDA
jgi:hypothetical protein